MWDQPECLEETHVGVCWCSVGSGLISCVCVCVLPEATPPVWNLDSLPALQRCSSPGGGPGPGPGAGPGPGPGSDPSPGSGLFSRQVPEGQQSSPTMEQDAILLHFDVCFDVLNCTFLCV